MSDLDLMRRSEVAVRPLQAGDFPRWLVLWNGYLGFYECELGPDVTQSTFERLLNSHDPVYGAVAEKDGALLGMVTCVMHRSTWSLTHCAYLEDLFVDPQARGGGVGRQLITWVRNLARAQACSRLYWHTRHDNLRARQLYDRLAEPSGFIEYRMAL